MPTNVYDTLRQTQNDNPYASADSYVERRKKDINDIWELLEKGYKPIWRSNHNWFELGKRTFNGWSKDLFILTFGREYIEEHSNDS